MVLEKLKLSLGKGILQNFPALPVYDPLSCTNGNGKLYIEDTKMIIERALDTINICQAAFIF